MNETSNLSQPNADQLEQLRVEKRSDPRASITRRGILLGLCVIVLGMIGAAVSIYSRRTRLEQTTEFWGPEIITALQLGERIELLSVSGLEFSPVELTATPGLGHLRHAFLDERFYDWTTASSDSVQEKCGEGSECVQLRVTDPTAHRFDTVKINVDLKDGWVGPSDGSRRVRTDRPAISKFLRMMVNVQQKRYDMRD